MMELDETFAMVTARQQDLRALARPQPRIPFAHNGAGTIRLRLGRALVRFGLWLDDRCPDMLPEPEVTTT